MNETEMKLEKETASIKKICGMLTDMLIESLEDNSNASTEEVGLVVDMIKDLAEAKEKTAKTMYYESVVQAMHDDGKVRELERRP